MTDARLCAPRATAREIRDQHDTPPMQVRKTEARHGAIPAMAPLWNLTPQQWRVFLLVGKALSNKAIAHELNVAESTIKAHVSAIFKMAGCRNRTEAALLSQRVRFGMLDTDDAALPFPLPGQNFGGSHSTK